VGPVTEQVVEGNNLHGGRGRVCERDMTRVRVDHVMAGQNYCIVDGCLLSYKDGTDSVSKRRHIRFRHRGITKKKAYNSCYNVSSIYRKVLVKDCILWDLNSIQEEIKSRLKPFKACCHSVQNLLSSSLLSKNLKIEIYRTIILPVVVYGCETW